jgi:hypothetical protein
MSKTLCHEDTQLNPGQNVIHLLYLLNSETFNVSVASSSLRSRSWNQNEREDLRNMNQSLLQFTKTFKNGDSRSKVHTRQREEESACHLTTLCIHWKPRVIPLGTTRLKWPCFYRPRGAPHFVVLSDGISGTVKLRYAALLSSSHVEQFYRSIYVYWCWAKWTKIYPDFFEFNLSIYVSYKCLQYSARVFYSRFQKISF